MNEIEEGYVRVLDALRAMKVKFLAEMQENPQDYEGFTAKDAYVWFVEGLS